MEATVALDPYLTWSKTLYYFAVTLEGTIKSCSAAVPVGFNAPVTKVVGGSLWDRMVETDAQLLREKLRSRLADQPTFLCNFTDLDGHPFTLDCKLEIHPDGFVLIGEAPSRQAQALTDQLLEMNNLLATITRENARQNKELGVAKAALEKALSELNNSHWHLKKIQEVLPICMQCAKVKTGPNRWDELLQYLKENSNFLSHGYCPECSAEVSAQWDL